MSSQISNKQISFAVQSSSSYFLTVIIGNGQGGSTTFKDFDDEQYSPKVVNVPIGKGSLIKGKSSSIVSVVVDINPDSDNLIVSYFLTTKTKTELELENSEPVVTSTMTVETNSTAVFITTINFI